MPNKIYLSGNQEPLDPYQIVAEARKMLPKRCRYNLTALGYMGPNSRISGVLCGCEGNGEFELLPVEECREGGKRYMRCRKCGEYSHL